MKITIKENGDLYIDRGRGFVRQECRQAGVQAHSFQYETCNIEKCPLFGEPALSMGALPPGPRAKIRTKLCHVELCVATEDFVDAREGSG